MKLERVRGSRQWNKSLALAIVTVVLGSTGAIAGTNTTLAAPTSCSISGALPHSRAQFAQELAIALAAHPNWLPREQGQVATCHTPWASHDLTIRSFGRKQTTASSKLMLARVRSPRHSAGAVSGLSTTAGLFCSFTSGFSYTYNQIDLDAISPGLGTLQFLTNFSSTDAFSCVTNSSDLVVFGDGTFSVPTIASPDIYAGVCEGVDSAECVMSMSPVPFVLMPEVPTSTILEFTATDLNGDEWEGGTFRTLP